MGKSQYIVKFAGLPVGSHEFEFEVKDKFFEEIEDSEIKRANIEVNLTLIKQGTLMQMIFKIKGTVEMDCDRCLIAYDFPIESEETLVVKHGNPDEGNEEVLVIPEGAGEADISHYLYEYIILALPSRKIPCEIDTNFECDMETLQKLNENSVPEKEEVNPLWEKLNKIKFNKN